MIKRPVGDHGDMRSPDQGHLVEDYARRLAGDLGVPDFVYKPVTVRRGGGLREVSDGLLMAGGDGLIVQVKSREHAASSTDSPAKAESWLKKKAVEAQRQVSGTRRTLLTGDTRVRSLRGFERTVPNAAEWPGVVILDHSNTPPITFDAAADTLFISLADWLDLHRMVRSTAGVIVYVQRALESGFSVPLGREADRYRALAAADLHAGGSVTSFPVLPPVTLEEGELWHAAFFDDLVERVADPEGATGWHADDYLRIVEQLDRIPLIGRVRIGAKMEQTFLAMREAMARRSFIASDPSGNRLVFLYEYADGDRAGPDGEHFIAHVAAYGILRQQHALESGADPESTTLGVGVLHHPERGRRYVFAFSAGQPPVLPVDLRRELETEFGIFTGSTIRAVVTGESN